MDNREAPTGEILHVSESTNQLITIAQKERTMICYGITENELEQVGTLTTQETTYFSLFTFLLALSIGFVGDWLIAGQPHNYGFILATYGAGVAILLSGAFLFLGIHAIRARGNIVKRCKEQSRVIGH